MPVPVIGILRDGGGTRRHERRREPFGGRLDVPGGETLDRVTERLFRRPIGQPLGEPELGSDSRSGRRRSGCRVVGHVGPGPCFAWGVLLKRFGINRFGRQPVPEVEEPAPVRLFEIDSLGLDDPVTPGVEPTAVGGIGSIGDRAR